MKKEFFIIGVISLVILIFISLLFATGDEYSYYYNVSNDTFIYNNVSLENVAYTNRSEDWKENNVTANRIMTNLSYITPTNSVNYKIIYGGGLYCSAYVDGSNINQEYCANAWRIRSGTYLDFYSDTGINNINGLNSYGRLYVENTTGEGIVINSADYYAVRIYDGATDTGYIGTDSSDNMIINARGIANSGLRFSAENTGGILFTALQGDIEFQANGTTNFEIQDDGDIVAYNPFYILNNFTFSYLNAMDVNNSIIVRNTAGTILTNITAGATEALVNVVGDGNFSDDLRTGHNLTVGDDIIGGNKISASSMGANAQFDYYSGYGTARIQGYYGLTAWGRYSTANAPLFLAYDGANSKERARLTTQGRLGLGTTTPNRTLDVNGSSIFRGELNILGLTTINNSILTEHGDAFSSRLQNYQEDTVDGESYAIRGIYNGTSSAEFFKNSGAIAGELKFYDASQGDNSGRYYGIKGNSSIYDAVGNGGLNSIAIGIYGTAYHEAGLAYAGYFEDGDVFIKNNVTANKATLINLAVSGNATITQRLTLNKVNDSLVIPNLKKIDGSTGCSTGDALKWDTGGRIYCG